MHTYLDRCKGIAIVERDFSVLINFSCISMYPFTHNILFYLPCRKCFISYMCVHLFYRNIHSAAVSALTGEGIDELFSKVDVIQYTEIYCNIMFNSLSTPTIYSHIYISLLLIVRYYTTDFIVYRVLLEWTV